MIEIIICAALLLAAVVVYLIGTMVLGRVAKDYESKVKTLNTKFELFEDRLASVTERTEDLVSFIENQMELIEKVLNFNDDLIKGHNELELQVNAIRLDIQNLKELEDIDA